MFVKDLYAIAKLRQADLLTTLNDFPFLDRRLSRPTVSLWGLILLRRRRRSLALL